MVIRNISNGFITSVITQSDALHLLRALERQIIADSKAHPSDAIDLRHLRDTLSGAYGDLVRSEKNAPPPQVEAHPHEGERAALEAEAKRIRNRIEAAR